MIDDPMERKIDDALKGAGIGYTADQRLTLGLDFKLSALPIYIEVKRMHSDRIASQMARADNVIAVQGKMAVEWMAALISESTCPLDLAYSKINALGGTVAAGDERGAGYVQAIDDALKILTDMGAKDAPLAALLADAGVKES